jgi:hypothetical protein
MRNPPEFFDLSMHRQTWIPDKPSRVFITQARIGTVHGAGS